MASLQIIIIGTGIAGLATGISLSQKTNHNILILESSPILTEAGAGIQCSAAASRILSNWGLRKQFEAVATCPDFTEIRRYEGNELIGLIFANVKNYSTRLRGFPHWLVHRVDYQKILAEAAATSGVKIEFGQKVMAIDVEQVKVILEGGRSLHADLIIGADGIHSRTRASIPGLKDVVPQRTENYCYRALVPREEMLKNPVTATLIDNQSQQAWAGQFKHIIAYPIAKGRFYNLVMTIPDLGDAPLGKYNEPGDVVEMRQVFKDFNDTVQAVLDAVDSCAKWVLAELPPLPTWSSPDGRVILVGDACHAMAPHAASGAATSLEDAEVLGLCVATCNGLADLPGAAKDYEHLRKARCERIQEISRENATTFALPDGPMQQARDRIWIAQKAMLEKQLQEDSPLIVPAEDMTQQFPHPALVQWLVGHDIIEEAKRYLASRE
ncbi:FAD binding domain-containing protein [Cladophialophora immunda]|nr:FAD binding domain-containing protein [Cladophialophora immunda]